MKLEKKFPLDIVIPVFNEGESIIKVIELINRDVITKCRIIICYDHDHDTSVHAIKQFQPQYPIELVKNFKSGPCEAVKTGFKVSNSECVLVYPGDDITNQKIIDEMFARFVQGSEIVAASRFMPGGSMVGCPIIKSVLVRAASWSLYLLSSIPIRDASNGFRLFSRKILDTINIESEMGFTYSLELLVKANRLKWQISEVPSQWIERKEGKSNFKVLFWFKMYLKWYFYGLATSWFKKKPTPNCLNKR
jgi:glycosyltransferase involved in cell wall biosynthesis